MYLCLMVGQSEVPRGLDGVEMEVGEKVRLREEIKNERRRRKDSGGAGAKGKKRKGEVDPKEWILKKKELYRVRGKEGYVRLLVVEVALTTFRVPRDSKYTARKRRVQF
jgi:18S rRNA (guanine1575-N7)-methyltransferase